MPKPTNQISQVKGNDSEDSIYYKTAKSLRTMNSAANIGAMVQTIQKIWHLKKQETN